MHSDRRLNLAYEDAEGNARIGLGGIVSGPDSVTGRTSGAETGGRFELERLDLDDLEEASLAVVQTVHDRNFRWLAEHGHSELRDDVGAEGQEDFEGALAGAFEDETGSYDYQAPPPSGVGVEVVGESFTRYESYPEEGAEFDYRTSDGGVGHATVALVQTGTKRGSHAFQVEGVKLDYRVAGEERDLVLGP